MLAIGLLPKAPDHLDQFRVGGAGQFHVRDPVHPAGAANRFVLGPRALSHCSNEKDSEGQWKTGTLSASALMAMRPGRPIGGWHSHNFYGPPPPYTDPGYSEGDRDFATLSGVPFWLLSANGYNYAYDPKSKGMVKPVKSSKPSKCQVVCE